MTEQNTNEQQPNDGGETPTFEDWLGQQDEGVQGLVNDHITGLRSALQSEREQRRTFERELRDVARQLDEDSEARQQLETMANNLDASERRAEFYEAAHAAGVSNLRLAWLAVQQDESLSDRRGNVNMTRFREQYPELFQARTTPPGQAGAGSQGNAPKSSNMNNIIRTAAGRTQ